MKKRRFTCFCLRPTKGTHHFLFACDEKSCAPKNACWAARNQPRGGCCAKRLFWSKCCARATGEQLINALSQEARAAVIVPSLKLLQLVLPQNYPNSDRRDISWEVSFAFFLTQTLKIAKANFLASPQKAAWRSYRMGWPIADRYIRILVFDQLKHCSRKSLHKRSLTFSIRVSIKGAWRAYEVTILGDNIDNVRTFVWISWRQYSQSKFHFLYRVIDYLSGGEKQRKRFFQWLNNNFISDHEARSLGALRTFAPARGGWNVLRILFFILHRIWNFIPDPNIQ